MREHLIKSVAIYGKPDTPRVTEIGNRLFDWLKNRNISVYLGEVTARQIDRTPVGILLDSIPTIIDLVIVLGGDGTILRVARMLESHDTPIMAVNTGGLGFLTGFKQDELYEQLANVLAGDFKVSKRSMLKAQLFRGEECIHDYVILNDAVIKKSTLARIIKLETRLNGEMITAYHGDGLIVSSPTGSTGYSLSAGGPIIVPHMNALVLTPICPHTLTHRPIVVSENDIVEVILISADSHVLLTVDGQLGFPMTCGDRVMIRRAAQETHMIQNPNTTFFEVLCEKLKWGQR
ncbi:NAD(+)/NADH kinase [bacterium]|nr:NAD(+)/NADH kinase [candidate division CSSED10-310 bacterium]